LLQKSKELELNKQIIGNNISIIDIPQIPQKHYKPQKLNGLLLGLCISLVISIILVLGIEHLDDSIKSVEDIEYKIKLKILGMVPKLKPGQLKKHFSSSMGDWLLQDIRTNQFWESVLNIRTMLAFQLEPDKSQVLLVTSTGPREGKTFLALSLAKAVVSSNRKVLLIDGDLRNPQIGKFFQSNQSSEGFHSLLMQKELPLISIVQTTNFAGLYCLPAQKLTNPAPLFDRKNLAGILTELKNHFDIIIIDSPPVIGFSEASVLASVVDGVIFVIKDKQYSGTIINRAKGILQHRKSNIVGAILTMTQTTSLYYGLNYSSYSRYYTNKKFSEQV
jgi:polysaccharide biosynthesis transport protein